VKAEEIFNGRLVLAPMANGSDLPFRRLVTELGAEVCFGEMAYAYKVTGRERGDRPLLRRHPSEKIFGVQLAGKQPELLAEAAKVAEDMGADFVDLNLGCPIDDATKRGFGAALLRRASKVAAIIAAMKAAVSIPVTIKLRLGWSSEKPTYMKVGLAAQEAGIDAVTLHARSRAQRYRRPADWSHIKQLAEALTVPVIGNGDIVSGPEAHARMKESGCDGVMAGRWALAKPWIFTEFRENREIEKSADERLEIIKRYVELCKEHFGDDDKGHRRIKKFLIFHQDFFRRYRPESATDSELESWLRRADLPAAEALYDWLVKGGPAEPPPPAEAEAPRAVKVRSHG
jgi:tRNA-dihydrouridine synthase 3